MKKVLAFLFVSSLLSFVFAQVSADKAARKTAERCLKLSENYLLSGNIEAALSQAELGITYDNNISDLYYIKAVAKKMNGATVREVLELSKIANDINTWVGYNEKGNRILYADLLSDTGKWLESLEVLDKEPFVFSADAEAIRIKNYYRIGTDEYLSKARAKINTARRIYKGDVRFVSLFFVFEISRCIKGGVDYVIPSQVLEIADLLNAELKSYKSVSDEIKCISIFFMEGEEQKRAAKAFDANGSNDSLYPVVALKSGIITEEKAFDLFFEFADKEVPVEVLKYFSSMITKPELKQKFYEHLNAYNGTLYVDVDDDAQGELEIVYERGRPQYIHFDCDSDGIEDLYGALDFGELLSVQIKPLGTEIFYSPYPWVGRVVLTQYDTTLVYEFSKNAAQISPLVFETPEELQVEGAENSFYVPKIKSNWNDRANLDYLTAATFVRSATTERDGATITYSMLNGNPVSAVFSVNGVMYASADFQNNLPLQRLVDYDGDGIFETKELFVAYTEDDKNGFSEDDKKTVKNLFPLFDYSNKVYLASIFIDQDNDNNPEYQELYMPDGGKAVTFFSPNGKSETHIRYPQKDGEPLIEASMFVTGLDNDIVTVLSLDGLPSSVELNGDSYEIFAGVTKNFYWIGKEYETSAEKTIVERMQNIDQGTVVLIEAKEKLFKCIKVGNYIYAKEGELLSVSDLDLIDENAETKSEAND